MEGSPLSHADLRDIERALDEGETDEAAARLALLADCREHGPAIDFLTTRLLFQRGRIDASGAADRIKGILVHAADFPEARAWLATLQPGAAEATPPWSERGDTPTQPDAVPAAARRAALLAASAAGLSRFEEGQDEVTPADPLDPEDGAEPAFEHDSSAPPPRPGESRKPAPQSPSARMPFDTLGAKEQLAASAGRYRESLHPPAPTAPATPAPASVDLAEVEDRIVAALEAARDGDLERAREELPAPPTPAGLSNEARATLARVLLEVGEAERAASEASAVLEAAPGSRDSQLIFAWCAVRYARQRDDAWSLERAGELLKRMGPGRAPEAGLLEALRACVEARIGSASVASGMAQRALRVNAESVDALAAMAEAAALSGEGARAEMALERLVTLSEPAAEQITPRLLRLGVGEKAPTSSASLWLPIEHSLYAGARDSAREALEELAHDEIEPIELGDAARASAQAAAAAKFLSRAAVLRHFGPFDASLASIARLEAALGLLYGHAARSLSADEPAQALWQACGLYLGDTLVQACRAEWSGAPESLLDACVSVFDGEVAPFQIVRSRLLHGKHARIPAALAELLGDAPRVAQLYRSSNAPAPAPPWGEPWPSLEDLPRLGRALGHSVVARHCKEHAGAVLDRSVTSLAALDDYLALVTPPEAALDVESDWARWLSGFVGGYLGEVLCRELGGVWRDTGESGAGRFGVTVGLRTAQPVAWVLESVTGTRRPLETLLADLRLPPRSR